MAFVSSKVERSKKSSAVCRLVHHNLIFDQNSNFSKMLYGEVNYEKQKGKDI